MHSSKLHLLQVLNLNTGCPPALQQQANLATHYCAGTDTALNTRCIRGLDSTTLGLKALGGRGIPLGKHLRTTALTMTEAPKTAGGKSDSRTTHRPVSPSQLMQHVAHTYAP